MRGTRQGGDFLRRPHAVQRGSGMPARSAANVEVRDHRRVDHSRVHRVHANPILTELN